MMKLLSKWVLVVSCALMAPSVFAGERASFWVWDLGVMPPGFRQPEFERALSSKLPSGDNVHIWIERNLGVHAPSQQAIRDLMDLLVTATPAGSINSKLGILEIEHDLFGSQPTPPSLDRDFNVVIADLHDFQNGSGMSYGFDGFFNAFDQLPEFEAWKDYRQHSNEKNIVYINATTDLASPYMQAVVAHELAHLITFSANDDMDMWMSEMIGEGAMQATGFFTDINHVNAYRQHPEWPLAVTPPADEAGVLAMRLPSIIRKSDTLTRMARRGAFRNSGLSLSSVRADSGLTVSYGGLSLLAEFLINQRDAATFGRLARTPGTGFTRMESVYGEGWNQTFQKYFAWLAAQNPASRFPGGQVVVRQPAATMQLATTGVLFLSGQIEPRNLKLTSVPRACSPSLNVLQSTPVRDIKGEALTALWVESVPPCPTAKGETSFGKDAFTVQMQ